ncbi:hypothetical protein [Streptomyces sp. TRM64462]|uniref:hypothetical protein n=1 Tax=Streptomyces sp. TRM64462 TaxID=2741726 RepID=UPI0015867C1C|nr:hypothetical protein [Streptomyces sp. TRM64462]
MLVVVMLVVVMLVVVMLVVVMLAVTLAAVTLAVTPVAVTLAATPAVVTLAVTPVVVTLAVMLAAPVAAAGPIRACGGRLGLGGPAVRSECPLFCGSSRVRKSVASPYRPPVTPDASRIPSRGWNPSPRGRR